MANTMANTMANMPEPPEFASVRDALAARTGGCLALCLTPSGLPPPLPVAVPPCAFGAGTEVVSAARAQFCAAVIAVARLTASEGAAAGLAAGEALTNAARHGGGGEAWACACADGQTVQVWVRDSGPGMRLRDLTRLFFEAGVDVDATHGRGLLLILSCVQGLALCTGPRGTTLVMTLRADGTGAWESPGDAICGSGFGHQRRQRPPPPATAEPTQSLH